MSIPYTQNCEPQRREDDRVAGFEASINNAKQRPLKRSWGVTVATARRTTTTTHTTAYLHVRNYIGISMTSYGELLNIFASVWPHYARDKSLWNSVSEGCHFQYTLTPTLLSTPHMILPPFPRPFPCGPLRSEPVRTVQDRSSRSSSRFSPVHRCDCRSGPRSSQKA